MRRPCRQRQASSTPAHTGAPRQRSTQHTAAAGAMRASRLLLTALWFCSTQLLWQLPGTLAANSFSQYAINWDATTSGSTATYSDLRADCVCALLNSTCTPNCCCDANCPAAAISGFRAAGSCLPEGPAAQQLAYCTSGDPLAKVNLPTGDYYRIQTREAGTDFLDQLLCINGDNNPNLGVVYPDPEPGDVGTNAKQTACAASPLAVPALKGSYSYGTAVVASYSGQKAIFTLPYAALGGECSDSWQLGFMQRMPASLKETESTCQRTLQSSRFAAMCTAASSLSPTYYTTPLFATAPNSATLVPVTLGSVTYLDPATGVVTSTTAGAPTYSPAGAGLPMRCSSVVLRAAYTLVYNAAALTSVYLDLTLTDISAAVPSVVLTQAFSATWANSTIFNAQPAAIQPLSGAPGYLPGFPVLAGVLATQGTQQAVSRFKMGLPLPGAGAGGACDSTTASALGFGYNSSSSCGPRLTLAQLQAFCTGGNASQYMSDALGGYLDDLASGAVWVGVWGNSNPATLNPDWVQLKPSAYPTTAMSWDVLSSTCTGVVTGYDVTLLTGVSYSASNLQSKVLYAKVCFRTGSWSFPNSPGAASTQRQQLSFTASFVPALQATPPEVLKPAPPLFKPLPIDLFYPFTT